MPPQYVHLHVHSEYSVLDGACRISQLVERCGELGMPAVTIDALPEGHPLLAGAIALQLLTLELVHQAGTNPDLIRREQAPYKAAADAAST